MYFDVLLYMLYLMYRLVHHKLSRGEESMGDCKTSLSTGTRQFQNLWHACRWLAPPGGAPSKTTKHGRRTFGCERLHAPRAGCGRVRRKEAGRRRIGHVDPLDAVRHAAV